MKQGKFLTFEGVDGCGKSTQMRFLSEYLQEKGLECVVTREPGGCRISEQVREILLDVENKGMEDMTEALLYAAARVQHIEEVILPAIRAGKLVLCDRYIDSSVAYQGYGRQLGAEAILRINQYAADHCMPDLTFFFDYKPAKAFQRMNPHKEMDRLEQEGEDFYDRVYKGFREIWKANPARVRRIDVSGTKFETRDRMRALIDEVLAQW
ncbi:MAG: dTMP kinase [Clostridiales bacterium]|nr:dTMP kinase [Clostridiales bacterium]